MAELLQRGLQNEGLPTTEISECDEQHLATCSREISFTATESKQNGKQGKNTRGGNRRRSKSQRPRQSLSERIREQGCCLVYGIVGLLIFLGLFFLLGDTCEGYPGIMRLLCIAFVVGLAAVGGYKTLFSKKDKWHERLLGAVFMVGGGVFVSFIVGMVAMDLFVNDLCVYQGEVNVETHKPKWKGIFATYEMSWEGDNTYWWTTHHISHSTMKRMVYHNHARVTYWKYTGIVKQVEPI